jgi:hypothetical protein
MEGSLSQAEKQEQSCDWLGAIECYENAIGMPTVTNPLEKIEIRERLSHAFFRAAMQAENSSEFRRRCAKAIECYEEARNSYKEFDSSSTAGRVLRCESMIALLRYWLAPKSSDRRTLIELCWELTNKALE